MNTWFTSDTHFGHKNLCLGSTSWDITKNRGVLRDFKDEHHMSMHLITQINKYVMPEDTLYHLGDWSFGGIDNIPLYRALIHCKTIHLILGNHDDHIRDNVPVTNKLIGNPQRAQSLFSSVSEQLTVKKGKKGRRIILNHYAMRTWHHCHKGAFQLHGHSHSSLEQPTNKTLVNQFYNQYRTMDVGIDNAFRIFKEYKPFHLNWILDYLNARPSLGVDHHDPDNKDGQ